MSLTRKIDLLSRHPLLNNADSGTLRSLAREASFEEVNAGTTILKPEEKIDGFYMIAYGRIRNYSGAGSTDDEVTKEFNRNESFGDISLITEAPSCGRIEAVTDSLLLKLEREYFIREIHENSDFNRLVNEHIETLFKSERERISPQPGNIISVISAESRVGKSIFGVNMASVLHEETNGDVCLVDFTDQPAAELEEEILKSPSIELDWLEDERHQGPGGFPVYSVRFPDEVSEGAVRAFLGTLREEVHFSFLVLPSGYDSIIENILNNSDRIYLLTKDEEERLYETNLLLDEVRDDLKGRSTPIEVVLNQSDERTSVHRNRVSERLGASVRYQLPTIEDDYVDRFEYESPYVNQQPESTYSKTVRHISHEAGSISFGLALGSGAARGLAHIGVIEVLEDENIKPDRVAGSSMGALVAAGYALGHSPKAMKRFAHRFEEIGGFFRVRDLSIPPNRSILRSSRIRNFLDEMFGDSTFDDTEMPLSVTVCDLDNAETRVIDEGPIVDAVLASISIPIIFEPSSRNGTDYIDGGILEPVPVETLRGQSMDRIIAVNPIPPRDVLREKQPERLRPEVEERDFHPLIKAVFPFGNNNLIDIGMRTIETIEARFVEYSTSEADVVIDPFLAELTWFDFEDYEMFIEQGRRSTRDKLEEIESLILPTGVKRNRSAADT